ncbi:dephospho-CoA kinase [Rhodospirillales bacterium TMPK1]|uniref:Dephospho-CoA kinase n=1 Tax=Roseiterribacter gracilis TaxID=2812848 RepID=A0A8S8XB93_9PROT|nr:dephospho-CoA kinase [Rhodospirillales bacterium TMPK1]
MHDSDASVHRLLGPNGRAVPAIDKEFPGVVTGNEVDRAALGARVFGDRDALVRLEAIVHPLVRQDTKRFLLQAARRGAKLVALDVPLLFEGGLWREVDFILVTSAPRFLQLQRALRRPGMNADKLHGIVARQTSDTVRRRHADLVLSTGQPRGVTLRLLRRALGEAKNRPARCWPPRAYVPKRKL